MPIRNKKQEDRYIIISNKKAKEIINSFAFARINLLQPQDYESH